MDDQETASSAPEGVSHQTDYRATRSGRRHDWYGLKKHVKRFLGLRIPHALLRGAVLLKPSLRASGRLPAPARLKEVQGHVQGARFTMLRPDVCVVAKELYWGRGQRPRPEDAFAIELFARMARRANVMLDIGAYTGIFTLAAAAVKPDLEAHAFEIVPDVYRALFDNCARNGILHHVTLHHVGVGKPGALMKLPFGSTGSALPDFYSSRLHFETGTLVRFVSLDSLVDILSPDDRVVIKVDVEGTEEDIFEHGTGFLAAFRPSILCEILHGVANGASLEALLAPHGYRWYLVREDSLLVKSHIEPDARFRDWLLTPYDAEDLIDLGIPVISEIP